MGRIGRAVARMGIDLGDTWLFGFGVISDILRIQFKGGLLGGNAGLDDPLNLLPWHPVSRLDRLPPSDEIEAVLRLPLVLTSGEVAPLDSPDLLVSQDDLATGADEAEAMLLVGVDFQVSDLPDLPALARTTQGFVPCTDLALQFGIGTLDALERVAHGVPCPIENLGTLEKQVDVQPVGYGLGDDDLAAEPTPEMPQDYPHLFPEQFEIASRGEVEVEVCGDPVGASGSPGIGLLGEEPVDGFATEVLDHERLREPRYLVASLTLGMIVDGAGAVIAEEIKIVPGIEPEPPQVLVLSLLQFGSLPHRDVGLREVEDGYGTILDLHDRRLRPFPNPAITLVLPVGLCVITRWPVVERLRHDHFSGCRIYMLHFLRAFRIPSRSPGLPSLSYRLLDRPCSKVEQCPPWYASGCDQTNRGQDALVEQAIERRSGDAEELHRLVKRDEPLSNQLVVSHSDHLPVV